MSEKANNDHTPASRKLIIAAVLLLIAAAAQFIIFNWPGVSRGGSELRVTDTQKGVTYDFDAGAVFYSYDAKYYYFCTKDGMMYMPSNGDTPKWQEIFSLSKPQLTAKGSAVAVGEANGKHIYVFNENGLLYDVTFDNPVLFFSVNQNGYLSVIMQRDGGYAVQVYNSQYKTEPYYANVIHDPLVHPLSVDVSEDGKYAVIALLDVNVRWTSRAAFYYMNAKDAWSTEEGLFAGEDYPDELIGCVKFMDNNSALVITDARIDCFQPGEGNTLNKQWTVTLHNELDLLAFYGGSRFAFATGKKLLNDDEASDTGVVNIYNMNGECTGEFALGRKATHLSMAHDAVLAGADRGFYALNSRGTRLWEHFTLQDTRQMIFLDDTDTVLMAGGARASVLKRMKPKATEQVAEETESDEYF